MPVEQHTSLRWLHLRSTLTICTKRRWPIARQASCRDMSRDLVSGKAMWPDVRGRPCHRPLYQRDCCRRRTTSFAHGTRPRPALLSSSKLANVYRWSNHATAAHPQRSIAPFSPIVMLSGFRATHNRAVTPTLPFAYVHRVAAATSSGHPGSASTSACRAVAWRANGHIVFKSSSPLEACAEATGVKYRHILAPLQTRTPENSAISNQRGGAHGK